MQLFDNPPAPSKVQQFEAPAVKIAPVKVPQGAKQIGNYILGKTIGNGSFGKVHMGLHIPTGQKVAVKIIEKLKLTAKDLERVNREIRILKKIMHPSLVQLYQILETEKSLLLFMEYLPNGELFNYIIKNKKLEQNQACSYFQQIIDGVEFLHNHGIAHRDLKPENILIDLNGKVKIIDFGLSNTYEPNQKLKTQCGSPSYAAPEMIEGKHRYNPLKTDIWSLGVVLYTMLCGHLPFFDIEIPKLYKKIMSGVYVLPKYLSDSAKDLLFRILQTNPENRVNLSQIKDHSWFHHIQYNKAPQISLNLYKIPVEKKILRHFKSGGNRLKEIQMEIEENEKNKDTAFYYLVIKRFLREGYSIRNYFGSPDFDTNFLKLKKIEIGEEQSNNEHNLESTVVQIEVMAPIPEVQMKEEEKPLSQAQLPSFNLKSTQFKELLKHFLEEDENPFKTSPFMKQIFYGNLDNQKKKTNLKLQKHDNQKRAVTVFRKRYIQTQFRSMNKFSQKKKKDILSIIQEIKNPFPPKKASEKGMKSVELPSIKKKTLTLS